MTKAPQNRITSPRNSASLAVSPKRGRAGDGMGTFERVWKVLAYLSPRDKTLVCLTHGEALVVTPSPLAGPRPSYGDLPLHALRAEGGENGGQAVRTGLCVRQPSSGSTTIFRRNCKVQARQERSRAKSRGVTAPGACRRARALRQAWRKSSSRAATWAAPAMPGPTTSAGPWTG